MSRSGPPSINAKPANPVLRIPFSRADLGAIEPSGGGGKLLAEVTPEYRRNLVRELHQTRDYIQAQLANHPGSMATLVLKLRENGIAKSHRPNKLIREAGLQIAGHDKIDEMLVAVHANSLLSFESVILNRQIQEIVRNLSAVEHIEAWDDTRKVPEGLDVLLTAESLLVRLFNYSGEDASRANYSSIMNLIDGSSLDPQLITQSRGSPVIRLTGIQDGDRHIIRMLASHPGVRSITIEPIYRSIPVNAAGAQGGQITDFPPPPPGLPTVAVFDTGVSPAAASIRSWVTSNETYVLYPDTRYEHGTMVASLVAGGKFFNGMHPWIPSTPCIVHDVCALEEGGSLVSDLETRLEDALVNRPDIKVWNLSLGGSACHRHLFSEFAMTLDRLSDQYGVLFVVAAGNYTDQPRRNWPEPSELDGADLVSSPGEAVRVLTVGSVAHTESAGALNSIGTPAAYSRRGPGPVFTPKPDVIHAGGGVHSPWDIGDSSLKVLGPDNHLTASFGTSFASPIVASIAAHTWQKIATSADFNATPSLVKALLIHSAQLSSPDYSAIERRYYGSGLPQEVINTLHDTDDRFTLIFQTQLIPGMRWRKENYPVPASLIRDDKFRGEIIITAAYSPPLDPNAGSEYVRANVEISFGTVVDNSITGKVPMEGEEGQSGYESAQVEFGGKWSSVKVHRKVFPRGTAHGNWAIQAKATLRANEPALREALPVTIVVTLKSLDGDGHVYADGVRALNAANWLNIPLPVRLPVTV